MVVRPELRKVLYTIGDLSHSDIETSVIDSAIKRETELPDFELNRLLEELGSLGLIRFILPRPSGANFRLVNITSEGLKELKE